MTTINRVLIVEDQKWPLMALEEAVMKIMPMHQPGFTKSDYDVAKSYTSAKTLLGSKDYRLVLLDNRMPYEDQGDLEDKDFNKFSATLDDRGYSLIPQIKEKSPTTIIVGTSSLSPAELRGQPTPDFKMRKMFDEAEKDLETLLTKLGELK